MKITACGIFKWFHLVTHITFVKCSPGDAIVFNLYHGRGILLLGFGIAFYHVVFKGSDTGTNFPIVSSKICGAHQIYKTLISNTRERNKCSVYAATVMADVFVRILETRCAIWWPSIYFIFAPDWYINDKLATKFSRHQWVAVSSIEGIGRQIVHWIT